MKILLIANFGPLFQSNWIYKQLIQLNHTVVTVGKLYNDSQGNYTSHFERQGNNHLPLFWKEDEDEYGIPIFKVDLSGIFEIVGSEWDVIIECESYNLVITDNHGLIGTVFDIPYFFYKTELLREYISEPANYFFYSGKPLFKLLNRLNKFAYDKNSFYLPFTFDPDDIPEPQELEYDLFFAGFSPRNGDVLKEEFKEIYNNRVEIIAYLQEHLGERFKCIIGREYEYHEYLKEAAKARIMLNVGIGCFNLRDFEALGLNKPLITLEHPEYEQFPELCHNPLFKRIESKEQALEAFIAINSFKKQIPVYKFDRKHHPKERIKIILEAIKHARQRIASKQSSS